MTRVITYGTFDLFHQGHYNILKRAKEQGDFLIVGVTGEQYDRGRGKLSIHDSLSERIENVRKTGFADLIIVEEYLGQKIDDILKYKVDIFVVGSDWRGKFDHLSKYCEVRYLERTKNISSSQIRQSFQIYRLGIITDKLSDNEMISEAHRVSGIHAEAVWAEDKQLEKDFAEKYTVEYGYDTWESFLDTVEIIYVNVELKNRMKLIEKALLAGKHVISNLPYGLGDHKNRNLQKLASENKVVLVPNLPMVYLPAFGQLLWMVRGNLIGDVLSMRYSMNVSDLEESRDFCEIMMFPVLMTIKNLGTDFTMTGSRLVSDTEGKPVYGRINLAYKDIDVSIEVGSGQDVELKSEVFLVGTKGTIIVPEEWWNISYIKMKGSTDQIYKRYAFDLEGNGLRYVIQDMMKLIREREYSNYRISGEEIDLSISTIQEAVPGWE